MLVTQQPALFGARAFRPQAVRVPATLRTLCLRVRAVAEAIAPGNGAPAAASTLANQGALLNYTPVPAPAPAPVVNVPEPIPGVIPPAAVYGKVVDAGAAKANLPWLKILIMGIYAGVYVGFGGLLSQVVGGNCPGIAASNPGLQKFIGGAVFPVGLMLVLICGAELFTGNTAFVTAALVEKRANLRQLLKSWVCSYAGNVIGSLLFVWAVAQTGLMANAAAPPAAAVAKTSLTWSVAFTRGVLCNVFVCLAIWMATAATSLPGKYVGAWLPISAFAAIGFEHSIANLFFIPMGIAIGAPVTVHTFLNANLLPVTLGNILGGVLVALSYAYAYGSLGKPRTQSA